MRCVRWCHELLSPPCQALLPLGTIGDELAARLQHEQRLKNALNVPATHPHAAYLHSLIDSVGAVDLADLTASDSVLQEKAPSYGDPNFRRFLFSEHPRPPETVYESPALAQPAHCYEPTFLHPEELLTPECAADLSVWLQRVQVDLVHVRDSPKSSCAPPAGTVCARTELLCPRGPRVCMGSPRAGTSSATCI